MTAHCSTYCGTPRQGLIDEETSPRLFKYSSERLLTGNDNPAQRIINYASLANAGTVQRQVNPEGGLPTNLKSGIESLSGIAMDDVRVHYNSSKPAQLQAHAYAQGRDIHIAPGQERHLPHEAWHVVQQKQGRVKPTLQLKGVAINDDSGLEREADVMGARAMGSIAKLDHVPLISIGPQANVQRFCMQEIAQLTKLEADDPAPPDGTDPEAKEIEWYQGLPYIADDKNTWRRVTREVVNNQRGERGAEHKVDPDQLRTATRKVYQAEMTKIFKVGDDSYLKAVYNYNMLVTAYYISSGAAKREVLGPKATDTQWDAAKANLPVA